MKHAPWKTLSPKTLVFLVLFISVFSTQGLAATYYVATSGNNTTGNGSTANPWATVSHALTRVSAGDTIKVQPGTYNIGTACIELSDPVRHANLTITAADPNNRPLIQGHANGGCVIWIKVGVKGVTISHLEMAQSTDRVIPWKQGVVAIDDNPTTIDNNLIYNGNQGIGINTGKNVTISNNVIHTMGDIRAPGDGLGHAIALFNFNGSPPATGWHEKIYIYNNEAYGAAEDGFQNVTTYYEYIEIAYNDFHDNNEDGVDWKNTQYVRIHHNRLHHNHNNGIGSNFTYPSHDFEVWDNLIDYNGMYGIMIQGANQHRWKMYNNIIHSNCRAPASWGADGVNIGGNGHEFYNNVVYNNNVPGNESNAGFKGWGIIKNNIFYNNGLNSNGNLNASGTIENNYVYPTSPGITGTNAITVSDPGLTDPANGDFTLKAGSPLIDAGAAVPSVTDDFAGTPRPIGTNPDIGAFEFNTGAPTVTLTPSVTSAVVPFTVSFTATATDSNGTIQKYEWDLDGNGTFEYDTGLVASNFKSYSNVGTYLATVRVTDNDGNTATSTRTINANSATVAGTGSGGGGGGGCFIATAAFGTPLASQVRVLSVFRDEYLMTNGPGRWFVDMYYSYSPPVADYIRDSEPIKAVVRVALIPLIELGDFMVNTTPGQKRLSAGLILALLTVAGSLLLYRLRNITGLSPLRAGR